MSRYIDADALKMDLYSIAKADCGYSADALAGLMIAERVIDNAPTVDAVEIVRCRVCKHWGDEDGKLQDSDGIIFARCKLHNYLIDGRHTGWCPSENNFCSYGERKDCDD